MQTTFYPRGDCLSAALASLFDLDIDEVPRFIDRRETFWDDFMLWLESMGYEYNGLTSREYNFPTIAGYYLVQGLSPRGHSHVVIYKGRVMVHDPHPEGGGLITIDGVYLILPKPKQGREG
jgi:hypothetical protein